MRGEYQSGIPRALRMAGSSPHAWGIHRDVQRPGHMMRFIPTCVGNTRSGRHGVPGPSVHPHMRGEYAREGLRLLKLGGSSPHAWGIRERRPSPPQAGRFIPTCVGNTPLAASQPSMCSVHPHMRGEYGSRGGGKWRLSGSSPHAWGIRVVLPLWSVVARFIPTCVGNTYIFCTISTVESGSSPHAWGILFQKT